MSAGGFVVWRTNNSHVSFDNLRVTGSPSSYNTLVYLHGDHLGSIGAVTNSSGALLDMTRFLPFGGYRGSDPAFLTERGFTGHKMNNHASNDLGLIYMGARFYVPSIGRFASADTQVPDPTNPQSYNRYTYVYNHPLGYVDEDGHLPVIPVLIAVGIATLKVIDYGWTAWDVYQAGRTLANPGTSQNDRMMAGLTVGMAVLFEAVEPDDILPVGLPIDDVARRAILNGAREALETGGPEAVERFLRNQLGDHADTVIKKMDELLGLDANSLYNATQVPSGRQTFTKAGRALQEHANRPGDIWAQYLPQGTLNPANYNTRASQLVQEVLTHPGTVRSYHTNKYGEKFIHYFAPDGRGLRFNLDGSFVGFINP